MESRPAPLRSRRVCRFCLTETEPLNFIYERDHTKPFQVPLTLQIMSCVAIEVYAADGMPQMICRMCRWNLDRSYKFKLQCKKADEALRAYPITGVLPRPFPPISNDSPDAPGKRGAEQSMQSGESTKKSRVDNGDRDRQRSDRQQEKHSHDSERNDLYKEDQEDSDVDQDMSNEKDDRKLEPGEIRVHACDQCDRTFPLRQALQLHIQRAHRDRNYKCTECDRMFFSKYDLAKHMTTHSSEKPYSCSICNKTFTRANLLQRHEKLHREDLRYGCQHCDREFFTTEELEKHEDTMHKTTKPYQCNICNKRFTYKQGLERHELLHNEDKTFVCEYCKEAFRTSTKLARHLATHSGHRPYLCKLCPRKFLLSHHLTRHMRSHSVEKRHVCEDCGKAFKRKESLEVHQLTHSKRSGMALTCDVCQESCRNRADYVTHIKQHIEAGEKMGPDGLQPDKGKVETESEEEEEEEEEGYTDGDDDYEPPAYVVKKLPKVKSQPPESEEEDDPPARMDQQHESEDRKEQVVFVRGKDGNIVKKTIKTLMPITRRDAHETPSKSTKPLATATPKKTEEPVAKSSSRGHEDSTEAEVQKIVASVFKEHKIPLKHTTNIPQENQAAETATSTTVANIKTDTSSGGSQIHTRSQSLSQKEEKTDNVTAAPGKSVNTVKVIKRIVVRKPISSADATSTPSKESENVTITQSPSGSATKVTKRVIVRRIIRQGDTTREVIMNPDGTIIDPAELAKLPTGNVVKRVVVKKALDNKNSSFVQQVLKPLTDARLAATSTPIVASKSQSENLLDEGPKFELKTSQSSSADKAAAKNEAVLNKGDQETKEKLELLEKRVEQQRIKIEELQARKQQETEAIDESLPERHDESEDEQQLPLKRVFVKRKQSIYDEEQEYDNDGDTDVKKEQETQKEPEFDQIQAETPVEAPVTRSKQLAITSSKVYTKKKVIFVKTEDPGEIDEMSREIGSILNSSDNVVKMQENVLTNLSQISGIGEVSDTTKSEVALEGEVSVREENFPEPMEQDDSNNEDEIEAKLEPPTQETEIMTTSTTSETAMEATESKDVTAIEASNEMIEIAVAVTGEQEIPEHDESATLALVQEDMSGSADIFESNDSICPKTEVNLEDSVIELAHNETINLNDTNESQDSLEDKLSQMEG
ncbi:uncharacterized protein [Venturia canescens]|uniref:uncharacterized protein n=1 Tax=Venturia canescens TaxID=32260 RepID=UPI001C9CE4FA|nr:uncharacterized protein LOC122410559 [Venturia canescens]